MMQGMVKFRGLRYRSAVRLVLQHAGSGSWRIESMTTKPPNFEIPAEMRDMAEKSVDQARKAFDGFMGAAYKAAGTLEGSTDALQAGTKDISRKAMTYAEQNVAAALEFASSLVRAKDPQQVLQLQSEFIRSQLQAFGEQAKDIGTSATKLASDVTKPKV
jgi:phasin